MLSEDNFYKLPGYKASYEAGEQVFFIPLFSNSDNPIHGIVTGVNAIGDIEVWAAGGEQTTTPSMTRPGSAKTVLAWLEMLKEDADLRAGWDVTVVCESPKSIAA